MLIRDLGSESGCVQYPLTMEGAAFAVIYFIIGNFSPSESPYIISSDRYYSAYLRLILMTLGLYRQVHSQEKQSAADKK